MAEPFPAAQASTNTGGSASKGTKKPAVATKTTAKPQQQLAIPTDAVARPDGSYTWTDKQGKNWLFVKTPFGVMKSQAADSPAATASSLAGVKVFDEGDKVRFERPSPFGVIKSEKSKSELTDDERALLASQTAENAKSR